MTIALTVGLIIMAILTPAFFCAGFYYGFNTAEGVFTQQAVTTENIPGNYFAEKLRDKVDEAMHPPETDEERLQRILAENVENFGTNVPQKEVV